MIRKGKPGIKLIKTAEGFPAVKASVETTKGVVSGCFYVDTGATTSFILDSLSSNNGIRNNVISIGNFCSETSIVKIKYVIDGIRRSGHFHKIGEYELGTVGNEKILGILGTDFLIANDVTIDFSKGFIYLNNRFNIFKKYHYSIQDGCERYKLPLIILNDSSKEYICLIDSASETNMMVNSEADMPNQLSDKKAFISGLTAIMDGKLSRERIKLQGIFDKRLGDHILEEEFNVISGQSCLLELDEGNLAITAVLGCHFLWKNKCIIDFQKGIFKI